MENERSTEGDAIGEEAVEDSNGVGLFGLVEGLSGGAECEERWVSRGGGGGGGEREVLGLRWFTFGGQRTG